MRRPGKRIPWMLLGLGGVAAVFSLGCGAFCGDFMIDVTVSSAEPLLLGDAGDDTGAAPPTLVTEIQPGDGWSEEQQLIPCEGSGFCLGDRFSLRGMGTDSRVTVEASDFVLSFDLEWQDADDIGDDGFSPITQQGGTSEVVLWNDWILDLDWGEPWNGCR